MIIRKFYYAVFSLSARRKIYLLRRKLKKRWHKLKIFIKKNWQKFFPPKIKVTRFIESGCLFEITSKMERYRVTSYGNEAETIDRVLAKIKPGDVFYDIGSCVGLYSIHAAICGAEVIAFEPDPMYRKRLKRNIKINKLRKSIQVLEWAVSDQQGGIVLYTDGLDGNSPSLRQVGSRGKAMVKTDTIDRAIGNGQIPSPNVIKMDIEGAEVLALRGMNNLLNSTDAPRFLFIEFHPEFLPDYDSSFEDCRELVESYGYREVDSSHRDKQYHYFYTK